MKRLADLSCRRQISAYCNPMGINLVLNAVKYQLIAIHD
jgi:hypothetical protein